MLILVFDQASKPHNKSNSFQYLYGGGGGGGGRSGGGGLYPAGGFMIIIGYIF